MTANTAKLPATEVHVRYFAQLKDLTGKTDETIVSHSVTMGDLYRHLQGTYAFKLDESELRVAINGRFGSMQQTLEPGDEIVFIPPVSGG